MSTCDEVTFKQPREALRYLAVMTTVGVVTGLLVVLVARQVEAAPVSERGATRAVPGRLSLDGTLVIWGPPGASAPSALAVWPFG